MSKRTTNRDVSHTPSYILPQWERQRRHRLALDRRVRSVRRYLLAGSVIGTVAFSALAGYETRVASGNAAATQPAIQAPAAQVSAANFFAGQSRAALQAMSAAESSALPTTTPTPTQTATPNVAAAIQASQTAQANTAAAQNAQANISATQTAQANIQATETAQAIPTDTPVPTEAPVVPQTSSRSQSSN